MKEKNIVLWLLLHLAFKGSGGGGGSSYPAWQGGSY